MRVRSAADRFAADVPMMPPIPPQVPHLVPHAEPSHAAAFCGSSVVWHISGHRRAGDTEHRNETRAHARNYHEIGESCESRHNPSQSAAGRFSHSPIDNAGDENRLSDKEY